MDKIDLAIDIANRLSKSDAVAKFLWGTYSDGRPRNLVDAMGDEILSPKQKKKEEEKKKRKKKKKKQKKMEKQNKKFNKEIERRLRKDGFTTFNF